MTLRSIFARFLEPFIKGLVSWETPGKCSIIYCFLWGASRILSYRFWSISSEVWCSAADTYLKLLDRVVSGASFLTVGVFEWDLAHRRSVAVLWMLYKIRYNPIHPLQGALHMPYVSVRITRGAVIGTLIGCAPIPMHTSHTDAHIAYRCAHRYTYAPLRCWTLQYLNNFIPLSVSLWKNLFGSIFDGEGLSGFNFYRSCRMLLRHRWNNTELKSFS